MRVRVQLLCISQLPAQRAVYSKLPLRLTRARCVPLDTPYSRRQQIVIRPATLSDVASLEEIEKVCLGYWNAKELTAEIDKDSTVLLTAESKIWQPHRLEGLVLVWCIADEAQIMELAVHPRARRGGIGFRLMQEALTISTQKVKQRAGRGAAVLEVGLDNEAAIGLYRNLGFVSTGVRRGYYPDGGDALLMRLPIK